MFVKYICKNFGGNLRKKFKQFVWFYLKDFTFYKHICKMYKLWNKRF